MTGGAPVLVAYDGTDEARGALLWALRETPADQEVVPVAVLGHEPSPLPLVDRLPHPPGETDRVARRIVARWDEDGASLRDVAELRLEHGRPAETLARVAADEGAALIVMGHRRSRRAEALRASVAEDLVRLAPCPVAVVVG